MKTKCKWQFVLVDKGTQTEVVERICVHSFPDPTFNSMELKLTALKKLEGS
jgi:hypothetical protein